jgi:hypothetical protein
MFTFIRKNFSSKKFKAQQADEPEDTVKKIFSSMLLGSQIDSAGRSLSGVMHSAYHMQASCCGIMST